MRIILESNFSESKNSKELEKKLKAYQKDLNEKFKGKIKELSSLTHDQAQYNSIIADLISKMNFDENLEKEEKHRK